MSNFDIKFKPGRQGRWEGRGGSDNTSPWTGSIRPDTRQSRDLYGNKREFETILECVASVSYDEAEIRPQIKEASIPELRILFVDVLEP